MPVTEQGPSHTHATLCNPPNSFVLFSPLDLAVLQVMAAIQPVQG